MRNIKRNDKKETKFVLSNSLVLLIIFVLIFVFFSLTSKDFTSVSNITSMFSNLSFMWVIAAFFTIVAISGEIDISVGGVVALITTVVAMLIEKGLNGWIVIIIALFIGIVIGCINGFLVTVVGVNSLIATLGMMSVTRGVAYFISRGNSVQAINPILSFIRTAKVFIIPFPVILILVVFIACVILMDFSKWGRQIYAIGANPLVSYLSGINVKKVKFISFVLLGFSSAIGAIILASLSMVGMGQHGMGLELMVASAVFLGGASLSGGKGTIFGTLIGVLLINLVYNGITMLNVQYYYVQIFQGSILIAAVAAYEIRKKMRKA